MTVQAAGQNPGGGCLTAASGPAKQIGVVNPVGRQCLHKGVGDLGLADELSKRLRSITSIESSHHALSLPRSPELFVGGNDHDGNALTRWRDGPRG